MESLETREIDGFWLAPQQSRLWRAHSVEPTRHLAQLVLRLDGEVDEERLRRALSAAVSRHEVLRTGFQSLPGMERPVQVVGPPVVPELLVGSNGAAPGAGVEPWLEAEAGRAMPLREGGGVLCRRVDQADGRWLIVTVPALAADAWSLENLFHEIVDAYGEIEVVEEPVDFIQFSEWQNEVLASDEEESRPGRAFWRAQADAVPPPVLAEERPGGRPAGRYARHRVDLSPRLAAAVAALADRLAVGEAAVHQAAWRSLLWRLSGGDPGLAVAVRLPGRPYEEMAGGLGLYERWPSLVQPMSGDLSFEELTAAVARQSAEALDWQELYEAVDGDAEDLGPPVAFDFHLFRRSTRRRAAGIGFEVSTLHSHTESCKLRLSLERRDGQLSALLWADPARYDAGTLRRLAKRFVALLESAVAAPTSRLDALEIRDAGERRLQAEVNRPPRPHGALADLLSSWRSADGAGGLEWPAGRLSHGELVARVEALAGWLQRQDLGPEGRVLLFMERGGESVVSMLAALVAGVAAVPVDLSQPAERRRLVVEAAGRDAAALVLAGDEAIELPEGGWPAVRWSEAMAEATAGGAALRAVPEEALAYVLFTSGSTGRPKGVMVRRSSVANLGEALAETVYAGLEEAGGLRVALNAPLSFDASVKQWLQLVRGHALVMVPEEVRIDGEALLAWLAAERVEVLDATPSQLRLLFEAGLAERTGELALRRLLVGGEAIDEGLWRRLTALEGVEPWNVYGPTETTVDATARRIEGERPRLGRPLANVRVHVVDRGLREQPLGVEGELLIGGAGVARGYAGAPAQTAVRFVPDPFSGDPGARLYRSGDAVRLEEDGELVYRGRLDRQVKLRGYRIELGEIESVIAAHPGVGEAAVVLREEAPGVVRLVGYAARRRFEPGGAELDAEALRAWAGLRLPEWMQPSAWAVLDELPLTRRGKVDREALPAPEDLAAAGPRRVVPPRTATEAVLVGVFADVLGQEQVGVDESFFDLGGHSLLATRLMSRVRAALDVELPLRALFEAATAERLAERVEAARGGAVVPAAPPIEPIVGLVDAPLSFAQQRLWFLWQLDPSSAAYNSPKGLRIAGPLSPPALAATLSEVARRHEVLRTTLPAVDGGPVQRVAEPAPVPLPVVDLARLGGGAEREARRLAAAEGRRPFDLATEPPLRTRLLRLAADDHAVLFTLHHVAADATSLRVLEREVSALYAAFRCGERSPLPELPVRYADYAVWQRRWLEGDVLEAHLDHWRRALAGAPPQLDLPTDRPRPAVQGSRGSSVRRSFAEGILLGVDDLARRGGGTRFMVLAAAFAALLSRFAGQRDVCLGFPVDGRERAEIEDLIGLFVNSLVLRVDLSARPAADELIRAVRHSTLEALAHQALPFERLVAAMNTPRDLSRTPLFQVMFDYQHGAAGEELDLGDVAVAPLGSSLGLSKFDLTLTVAATPSGLVALLNYDADLFEAVTAERLLLHLERTLAFVLDDPSRRFDDAELLDAPERLELLSRGTGPAPGGPAEAVVAGIRRRAAERPDAIALDGLEGAVTYRELLLRVDRAAGELRRLGVGPEVRVAVSLERGADSIVALLAVLTAGGAYVPIDPADPAERKSFVLRDAEVRAAIVHRAAQEGAAALPVPPGVDVVELDAGPGALPSRVEEPPWEPPAAAHAAYVIYTSGSTGQPKGVVVSHASLAGYTRTAAAAFGIAPEDRVLQFSSLAFDASAEEIYPTLTRGATLVLRPPGPTSPAAVADLAARHGVTILDLPTAFWHELVREMEQGLALPTGIRLVIIAGEQASMERLRTWRRLAASGPELVNTYGPTEATIVTTAWRDDGSDLAGPGVPIGRPVAGMRNLVLDRGLRLVPDGTPGELVVGGPGVARGYLGRPALSAERFVPDPFGDEPGARLYRTGDLVRWLPCGELEFRGRVDHQVKVRGFRVELGEVEAVLRGHPAVAECAVDLRRLQDGGELVAWWMPSGDADGSAAELRSFLQARLPRHMVPGRFQRLPEMPKNRSGKIDRHALPTPEGAVGHGDARSPRGELEEAVALSWRRVLGVAALSAEDDFFVLGGHSLQAIRLAAHLGRVFGIAIEVREVFDHPTVASLADRLRQRLRNGDDVPAPPPLRAIARSGDVPASFAQRRLWFLSRLDPRSAAYHVPLALRLRGPLEVAALAGALNAVVRRHEVLRTRLFARRGEPMQRIVPQEDVPLPVVDLTALPASRRGGELEGRLRDFVRRPFDLEAGPIHRWMVLRQGDEEHALAGVVHHAATDGRSMELLVRELSTLYAAALAGEVAVLDELPLQYADYAAWQRRWLSEEVVAAEVAWWRRSLAGLPAALHLPTDRPRPAVRSGRGGRVAVRLDAATSERLHEVGSRLGATLFMVLLAAYQALLARLSRQTSVAVGTPVLGRPQVELDSLIGFFVNTVVLPGDLSDDPSFEELVGRSRDTVLAALSHGDLPFEKLVEALSPERNLSQTPLFQAMLLVLPTAGPARDGAPELPGGLRVDPLGTGAAVAQFDLTLSLGETPRGHSGALQYASDLFDRSTIERLAGQLAILLAAGLERPEVPVWDLPLLSEAELVQLRAWSVPAGRPAGPWRSVVGAVAERAAERPATAAVAWDGGEVSYGELEARSSGLAARLAGLGVGRGSVVALLLERGAELVVSALAVVRAGAAYLPIEPQQPRERIDFLLADSGAAAVIAVEPQAERLRRAGLRVVEPDAAALQAAGAAPVEVAPEDLAYVIYTSGSTGQPKGTMVSHRALSALVDWHREAFEPVPGEAVTLVAGVGFDPSVWEVWSALAHGTTLHVPPASVVASPPRLAGWLAARRIAKCFLPTPLAEALLAEELPRGLALQVLWAGGDRLTRFAEGLPFRLVNCYGPTEAAVIATIGTVGPRRPGLPTIGRPLPHVRAWVLDRRLAPVPVGVPGELFLAGAGLARGYLGRPGLTAERWLPDPHGDEPGERMYRTGDLVRWLPSGELDFLGRLDHQVKVRGFRVELGEIESVLRARPDVADAVVVARGEGAATRLAAYLVPVAGAAAPPVEELRRGLGQRLPEYMVPAWFEVLESMPLSPSGKVDRRALPDPSGERPELATAYVAPRNAAEETVAAIWRQVLGSERVGVHDDFFALGGHSLLATQVLARVQEVFRREVPLRKLFERPTVSAVVESLVELWGEPGVVEEIAATHRQVEAMSEDEVRLLLAGEASE